MYLLPVCFQQSVQLSCSCCLTHHPPICRILLCRSSKPNPSFGLPFHALDKNPGVHPIGIGEMSHCIISKPILVKTDILNAAGNLQLCAGQEAGCEAAVHAMQSLFHSSATQAVLLADASNAFNSLNQRVSLHNLHFICPPLAITFTNVYREASSLIIGGECLLSEEGTTQGDPLAIWLCMLSPLYLSYRN